MKEYDSTHENCLHYFPQINDNLDEADGLAENLQAQCTSEIAIQMNTSSPDADQLQEELLQIENNICPNSCSGNGTCMNGTCICNTGTLLYNLFTSYHNSYHCGKCGYGCAYIQDITISQDNYK